MSVLIKGMGMPKNCFNCSTKIDPENRRCDIDRHIFEETLGKLTTRRDDDCPLVEVPTPHGRLIDGEKAKEELRRAEALTRAFGYHNVIETISEVPTIIEAEEGDPDVNFN